LGFDGVELPYNLAMTIHWDKDLGLSSVQINILVKYLSDDTEKRFKKLVKMNRIDILKLVSYLVTHPSHSIP
jgi:hypothetical protein